MIFAFQEILNRLDDKVSQLQLDGAEDDSIPPLTVSPTESIINAMSYKASSFSPRPMKNVTDDDMNCALQDDMSLIRGSDELLATRKKSLTFDRRVSVILIPSLAEYRAAGCDLWFSQEDVERSRGESRREIQYVLQNSPFIQDVATAMRILYQPQSEKAR
jgi:hypothetical protein